jgi:hypothetical protein
MKTLLLTYLLLILTINNLSAVQVDTTRIYGVTIDAINNLSAIVTSLSSLCKKPTTRIVFDEWIPATDYQNAVNQIHNVSFIMGEILDSYYMSQYTVQQFTDRTNEYVNLLGNKVDIWEIGNEINGEWLGNTSDVVAKMNSAYNIVKAKNYKTELTLYYNYNCWSKPQNEMFRWAQTNISQTMKNGLDYVLISYYEDDCNNYQPNWQRVFDSLHTIFPNAKIGIGECGTTNTANKAAFINRYYKMNITTPKYVGGYFWWYYKQDCVPYTTTLWNTLHTAIANAPAPTVQASQLNYSLLTITTGILSWTGGNGTNRIIFLKDGTTGTPTITDGITYNANSTFGLGTSDGNGWYCVYKGTGVMASNTVITGLISGHSYRAMVLEYNGNPGFEGYNRNTNLTNPYTFMQSVLPVELISFISIPEKNNVNLKWITSIEKNNEGFYVERKNADNNNWVQLTFIKGKGNSNVLTLYSFKDKNLEPGNYYYRLMQVDYNGNHEYYYLSNEVIINAPIKFELMQNYPNPFNPVTKICFALKDIEKNKKQNVKLKIFDIQGKEVKTLVDDQLSPGNYEVTFEGNNFSTGVYFYRLIIEGFTETRRMLLIK